MTSGRLLLIWTLIVGLTFIVGRKSAAADYVRKRGVRATKEQMQAIYLFIGAVICILAVVGMAVSLVKG
jgi:hypothetical protein